MEMEIIYVSILVLLDVSLEVHKSTPPLTPTKFQSLFSWMFPSKLQKMSILALIVVRFNPCSLGCFPRRPKLLQLAIRFYLFQSLFSWMFPSKYKKSVCLISTYQFQSLFSWMFPSKCVGFVNAEYDTSFNPCSLGCFPRSIIFGIVFCIVGCFNPCSLGCFPRSLLIYQLIL